MKRLIAIAAGSDFRVRIATITPGIRGFIDYPNRTIYISRRLTPAEMLCTLAHELGHMFHGHDCSRPGAEDQANAYACRLLIAADAYAKAERLSEYVEALADELGVTIEMIHHYQRFALQRVGTKTYARAPLGLAS